MKKIHKIGLGLVGAAILGALGTYALGQQSSPTDLPGCVYNSGGVTLSDKQSVVIQCDVNGKILVH